jgi:hypothetical protein
MENKEKYIIMANLRKVFLRSKVRKEAKQKYKVGPSTHICCNCGVYVYSGSKTLEKHLINFELPDNTEMIKGKTDIDHKVEIGTFIDWNTFIDKLFCNIDNLQCLCQDCHKIKSKKSTKVRAANRKKKIN